MGTHYMVGGLVSDGLVAYHARRAKGGCAMNIVEIASVHYTTSGSGILGAHDDKFIPGLTKLVTAIHDAGGKACVQLWHGGRQHSGTEFGGQCWGPSEIPCPMVQEMPHAMTLSEVKEIISAFGDAAARAKKAGFDAVELHGAHGYLIDCFLNEYSNNRTDEYGGSFENRARFGQDVIRCVRSKVGPDYPVLIRMSAQENYPGGITLQDGINAAKLYEAAGADAIDISQGCYGALAYTVPPYYLPELVNVDNASQIKKNVGVPVIVAGKIYTPELAEEILQKEQADFISLGRIQLADPDFVNKTAEDRADEIVHCIACDMGCVDRMFNGERMSCIFNPLSGYEAEIIIEPARKKRKVLVIGGGPGGLEAARVAKERGHDVTLFEKGPELGGQYVIAGYPPHKQEFAKAARHMGFRALKAGVDIKLYTVATPERIKSLNPDIIIVATGSEPVIPAIPGVDNKNVYEARRVISGSDRVKAQKVAVVGAGLVGLEVVEVLVEQGKQVVLIEMLDEIGKDLADEIYIRPYALNFIAENGVEVHLNAKCVSIGSDSITIDEEGQSKELDGIGAVVLAVGAKSDADHVADMAKASCKEFYIIGDAKKPGKVINAIWQGNEIARTI
jgi:2,4-dienoyl-CoA reductase-like NADH-dependent reductase (Old Yellow Enzyme family)/thioredoxin reductase